MNKIPWLSRWIIPSIIAFISLIVIGGSLYIGINTPFAGIEWNNNSYLVETITDEAKPYFNYNDTLISIDGHKPLISRVFDGKIGDTIIIKYLHAGEIREQAVILHRQPNDLLFLNFLVIFSAFLFWTFSLIAIGFGTSSKKTFLLFAMGQIVCNILAVGQMTSLGFLMFSPVFRLLLCLIGPVMIHLHLSITEKDSQARLGIRVIYILAAILSVSVFFTQKSTIVYLWLGATLIASIGLLVWHSIKTKSNDVKSKTRFIGFAVMFSVSPFIFLSLLPEVILGYRILPYPVAFLSLPIMPLGYTYAVFRQKLIPIEKYIRRTIAYAILAMTISIMVFFSFSFLFKIFQSNMMEQELSGAVLIILIAVIIRPLSDILQRWVDTWLYGGWYDENKAATNISNAVANASKDSDSIVTTLCQTVEKTLQLEYVRLMLNNRSVYTKNELTGEYTSSAVCSEKFYQHFLHLNKAKGDSNDLASLDAEFKDDITLVFGQAPQSWFMLKHNNDILGVLVLGWRIGGGEISTSDMDILAVVIRQASAAIANAFLLNETRDYALQVKNLNGQILLAREDERKRVARDLHDKAVQTLVGLNYQIATTRKLVNEDTEQEIAKIQAELRDVIKELRQVCADLRPPAIDAVGFIPALQSHLNELRSKVEFDIKLDVNEYEVDISESIGMGLFRFVQEAMTNIAKHANARSVTVSLQIDKESGLVLCITDDGTGFIPPKTLGELAQKQHFGLVGLNEQIENIGGAMTIISSPGNGCSVFASVPYTTIELAAAKES